MRPPAADLTTAELQDLARLCRARADLARLDAERQAGTSVAAAAAVETAGRYDRLAAKLEQLLERAPIDRSNVTQLPVRSPGRDHVCDRDGAEIEVRQMVPTCSKCGVPQVFD